MRGRRGVRTRETGGETIAERPALVFLVPALHPLGLALLHLALEDPRAEAGRVEDLYRVEPRVDTPSHHRDALAHPGRVRTPESAYLATRGRQEDAHLVDVDPAVRGLSGKEAMKKQRGSWLLYSA